jgi:hypothetical protein
MSKALMSGEVLVPTSGAFCPTWEVVKKTGVNPLKSFSVIIRSMRTDPTIPRQPIIPTFFIIVLSFPNPLWIDNFKIPFQNKNKFHTFFFHKMPVFDEKKLEGLR